MLGIYSNLRILDGFWNLTKSVFWEFKAGLIFYYGFLFGALRPAIWRFFSLPFGYYNLIQLGEWFPKKYPSMKWLSMDQLLHLIGVFIFYPISQKVRGHFQPVICWPRLKWSLLFRIKTATMKRILSRIWILTVSSLHQRCVQVWWIWWPITRAKQNTRFTAGLSKFDSGPPSKNSGQLPPFDIAGCVQPTEEYLEEGGRSEGLFPDGWIFSHKISALDRPKHHEKPTNRWNVSVVFFRWRVGWGVERFGWWSHIFDLPSFLVVLDAWEIWMILSTGWQVYYVFFGAGFDFQHRSAKERWLKYSFWV